MSVIKELWSESDQLALENFEQALDTGKLSECLFAIERADNDSQREAEETLDRLAAELQSLEPDSDVFSQASALAHVLADDFGLRGDTDDYFAPENSFLSEVLKSRTGLPILVSSVWIIAARRAGMKLQGIGLPQHFIVQLGDGGMYLDPFSGGAMLTAAECREIVNELSDGAIRWKDEYLEPVSDRDLCERVVRNLCNSYSLMDDEIRLYQTVRFHAAMRPDIPQVHMLLGRLSEDFGDFTAAREAYHFVVEQFPEHDEAKIAAGRIKDLGEEPKFKN
jgi:regulator of sirC expression with transglutaminase-like and TPR domain